MTARWITADVFDGLDTLEDGSVDLVVTSPPFLALRSYLPADHPDKHKEIGSEATPAEFIDVLLKVTAELRRVLAPHGSICVELGDTYAGSGGGGGDYLENGWREGQQQFAGSEASMRESNAAHWRQKNQHKVNRAVEREGVRSDGKKVGASKSTIEGTIIRNEGGSGWPLAKSRTLIPQLYEIALAYGINPLTGQPSPAGQWRIRNVVTWARPNPPVGALGDKWRPATSDLIVACVSPKRYWDDLATRKPISEWTKRYKDHYPETTVAKAEELYKNKTAGATNAFLRDKGVNQQGAPLLDYWEIPLLEGEEPKVYGPTKPPDPRDKVLADGTRYPRGMKGRVGTDGENGPSSGGNNSAGAPLLDYWEISPGGYKGSHYAVFPEELVVPCVKAMCPEKVCRVCGEPSRRIVESETFMLQGVNYQDYTKDTTKGRLVTVSGNTKGRVQNADDVGKGVDNQGFISQRTSTGWTTCGHDDWRPGLILDPFAGSGTTLAVATGHGHDAIGIDLDPRNADLARDRIGPFLFEETRMQ